MDLKGKVALVTGSAVRIGRAIVLGLAERGVHVIIHYRHSQQEAKKLVKEIERSGGSAQCIQCDLSNSQQIKRMAKQAIAASGRVDILVNNASEFFKTPLQSVTTAQWDRLLDVNLKAPFLLSRFLGLHMLKRGTGKIINIADISAFRPWSEYIPYCVSKSGMVTLTQGLAKALAPKVQVNAIAPGTILPPITGWTWRGRQQTLQANPLKKIGSPLDIVRTVLFLINSDYITGTVIPVDGGRLMS